MSDVERLRKAVEDLHGVKATFIRDEPVLETFRGQTVWEGTVAVFSIVGRTDASLAYAWSHETDEGNRRYVAILGMRQINSAVDAVRVAAAAEIRQKG